MFMSPQPHLMSTLKAISSSTCLTMALTAILYLASKKKKNSNQSSSAFECGFNKKETNKPSFSSQYFMTAILFLIFDLEIVMIMPTPMTEKWNQKNLSLTSSFMILITLILMIEWKVGGIEWSK